MSDEDQLSAPSRPARAETQGESSDAKTLLNGLFLTQKIIGESLTASNAAMQEVNQASEKEYDTLREELKKATRSLVDMKRDLETIFEKIRRIRGLLQERYGAQVQSNFQVADDE